VSKIARCTKCVSSWCSGRGSIYETTIGVCRKA
jgi:hypothetical protein